jgi:hypothetical protein
MVSVVMADMPAMMMIAAVIAGRVIATVVPR